MPDPKPTPETETPKTPWEQTKAVATVLVPVGGTVVGVISWLATKPRDEVFLLVTLSAVVLLALVGLPLWFWKRTYKLPVGDPVYRRRFPRGYAVACWVGALVVAVSAMGVWHGLKDELRPVAKVELFNGFFAPVVPYQLPERTGKSFVEIVRDGRPPPLEDARIPRGERKELTAYPAVVANLKKYGTGRVQIDNVRFRVERPQFGELEQLTGYGGVPEAVEPNQYLARIQRDRIEVDAELFRDGKRSAAVPIMDDVNSLARLHVGFEGEAGLYLVKLVVTVRDENGYVRAVESEGWALVNTHLKAERWTDPAEERLIDPPAKAPKKTGKYG